MKLITTMFACAALLLPIASSEAAPAVAAPARPAAEQLRFICNLTVGQEHTIQLESPPSSGCCWRVDRSRGDIQATVAPSASSDNAEQVTIIAQSPGKIYMELVCSRPGEDSEVAIGRAFVVGYAFPVDADIPPLSGKEDELNIRLAPGQCKYFRFETTGKPLPPETWVVKLEQKNRGIVEAQAFGELDGNNRHIVLTGLKPGNTTLLFARSTYLCKHPKVSRSIRVNVEVVP